MEVRLATPADADEIARLHVQSWQEAYADLLPRKVIDSYDFAYRQAIWTKATASGATRIAIAPGLGFAQVGPQREDWLKEQGFPSELWCLYVLREAYGAGVARELMEMALGPAPDPFTATVFADNRRACAFYQKQGGKRFDTRDDTVAGHPTREHVYAWCSS